eukprot:TRINITY_DN2043_c0_g1_i2.p1 TRINITY_DN2043_c0_g1~~TRINITY_DN2043_c0_g1_i2.p1  ORF type:complete len:113 (+),score=27.27 TRINITY_DN2043_c0_g1_i2:57-395(+)
MAAWLKGWFGGAPKADAAPKIPAPVAGGKETFDAGGVAPELVGAARWEAIRAAWNVKTSEPKPRRRQDIDVDGISYALTHPHTPFQNPVPLPDMVGILVEVWEEDGLFSSVN